MKEMQEIESQRAVIPPVPASRVKDHLTNDAWALQYLEDGKHFTVCLLVFVRTTFFKCFFFIV